MNTYYRHRTDGRIVTEAELPEWKKGEIPLYVFWDRVFVIGDDELPFAEQVTPKIFRTEFERKYSYYVDHDPQQEDTERLVLEYLAIYRLTEGDERPPGM